MLFFIAILFTHFVADFVLQSHWMASNKSSSNIPLLAHIGVYSLTLTIACLLLFDWQAALLFGLINGVMHFITDYFTSRLTSKLWKAERVHDFFVVIGLDQFIHSATLGITFVLLLQ